MMAPRGNARGLVEWSRRDPWRERMAEMVERHIRRACDLNGIDIYDLQDVIGEHAMVAMDCAFEDCCAAVWEGGSNLATDYLKRRGWKETAINRAFIQALRDSLMSLHEVSDVRPGESFLARDLVRGGDPIRVTERTATKTLVQWDIIATRIITVRGVVQMAGAVLAVKRELADEMLALIRRTQGRASEATANTPAASDPLLRARLEAELAKEDTLLSVAASAITTLWLNDTIRRYLAPLPEMANSDGEKIEFMTLHYRLLPGITAAKVAEALAGTPDIRDEDDGEHWIWFAPEKPGRKGRKSAQADHEDTGRTIYGHLTLGASKLEIMVNSEDRATRIRNILAPILDGLVQSPLVERITPEQAMAARGGASAPAARSLPEGMSPEDMHEAVHQFLDRQYRNVLRQKVPALGDKTPRQAVRSAKGRQAVANWLKGLEQNNARLPADDPMHDYDFSWMWEELGITDLRS